MNYRELKLMLFFVTKITKRELSLFGKGLMLWERLIKVHFFISSNHFWVPIETCSKYTVVSQIGRFDSGPFIFLPLRLFSISQMIVHFESWLSVMSSQTVQFYWRRSIVSNVHFWADRRFDFKSFFIPLYLPVFRNLTYFYFFFRTSAVHTINHK